MSPPVEHVLGDPWLSLIARLIIASVFLMAAVTKLRGPAFAADVRKYGLLPSPLAAGYAAALPWLELIVAILLFGGVGSKLGAGIALVLLLSFMIAVVSAMLRHLNLDCSCFGLLYRERIGWSVLARDGVLAGLALEVLLVEGDRLALPAVVRSLHRPSEMLAFALTLAAAAASLSVLMPDRAYIKQRDSLRTD